MRECSRNALRTFLTYTSITKGCPHKDCHWCGSSTFRATLNSAFAADGVFPSASVDDLLPEELLAFLYMVLCSVTIHPSRHCEIRLSLSQLCGVNEGATTVTKLGSVCAALIRRRESFARRGAQRRGLAPSWCHHGATDRVGKLALVETGETVKLVAATAACGRQLKLLETSPSTFSPAFRYVSIAQESINTESRLVGGEAAHGHRCCHQPRSSLQQNMLLAAMRTRSGFSSVSSPVGHHSMDM